MNEIIARAKMEPDKNKRKHLMNSSAKIFQSIDMLCDTLDLSMPDEAISANVFLDEFFKQDVLSMEF